MLSELELNELKEFIEVSKHSVHSFNSINSGSDNYFPGSAFGFGSLGPRL